MNIETIDSDLLFNIFDVLKELINFTYLSIDVKEITLEAMDIPRVTYINL